MNTPQNNFFYSLCLIFLFFSCGGGGNRIIEVYDTGEIIGEWLFSPNCEEYILGSDTIYLENELPDTISIFSNSDNVLSIDAGNNVLDANIDISGDFYIRYQSFKAFLEIGNIADTATIYLTGNGNFSSSNDGTMDLTFSEPNLPGQIECSILLTKLD